MGINYFVINSFTQIFDVKKGKFVWVGCNKFNNHHELHIS